MAKKLLLILLLLFPVVAYSQSTNSAAGLLTASGSGCTAANCVTLSFYVNTAFSTITLSGSWSATVQYEVSGDHGVTWVGAPIVTSATGNGTTQFNVSAYTNIRARVSAFVSGPVNVTIIGSTASGGGSAGGGAPLAPQTGYYYLAQNCGTLRDAH
jgi:hypothetical protein